MEAVFPRGGGGLGGTLIGGRLGILLAPTTWREGRGVIATVAGKVEENEVASI